MDNGNRVFNLALSSTDVIRSSQPEMFSPPSSVASESLVRCSGDIATLFANFGSNRAWDVPRLDAL